jgi:succinate dehydrogenase/fumarate reductase cytochrome b subunit
MKNLLRHGASLVIVLTFLAVPMVVFGQWETGISNAQSSGVPEATVTNIIRTIMNWLLAILGFLGIIGFVIAGIMYLVAAGDEKMIDRAKTAMTYSIVGIIVALIGFVIIRAVDALLNASGNNI